MAETPAETSDIAKLDPEQEAEMLRRTLQMVAPGTELREALERIQRSHTGGLIVLGFTPEVELMCSGGFEMDVPFSAASLRELCKMDGAVIVDTEKWRIRRANVQLLPATTIPTTESGTRHRTAQRVARQAGLPVLSLSSSMKLISIYVGSTHHTVEEPEALLSRANLAVNTLDRYTQRLDEVMTSLGIFEMRNAATIRDVATVIQRMEMIRRITAEISGYLEALGAEGRLLALQVDDLLRGSASERTLVLRDYVVNPEDLPKVEQELADFPVETTLNLEQIANTLGWNVYDPADLDRIVHPRGIRVLSMVPRLPWDTIKAICEKWTSLEELRNATSQELQTVEGIGPYRAQMIVEHLQTQTKFALETNGSW